VSQQPNQAFANRPQQHRAGTCFASPRREQCSACMPRGGRAAGQAGGTVQMMQMWLPE